MPESGDWQPEFMKADGEQADPEADTIIPPLAEGPEPGQPWGGSLVKDEDTSWGDHMLTEKEKLSFKHETLAHMAASGFSNKKIAQDLSMTEGRISILLGNSRIEARIKEIQAKYWGGNIEKRFKRATPKAMDIIDQAIGDQSGTFKAAEQLKAAMWLLEKVTGKAKQEVDHSSVSLGELLRKMDDMIDRGEAIDVSPQLEAGQTEEEKEASSLDKQQSNWIDQNLGEG